jgi:hypothetical protein
MSEQAREDVDGIGEDVRPVESNGELVHWMARRPLTVGPAGISAAAAGAFALGAVATVVVLALMHWLGPERQVESPRRWRFGRGA